MIIMKNKTLITLIFTLLIVCCNTLLAQKQKESDIVKFQNGNFVTNPNINQYVGIWKSNDGKFTFEIVKSVNTFKTKDLNYKSEVLVLKIVSVNLESKQNDKIIKKPINFLSVNKYKANTIFTDPTTENEVDLILMFKNKDLIEFFTLNSINGDKRKGSYFPEKMTLKKVD